MPEVAAIEGLWAGNDTFVVLDDSYFHNYAPNLNRVVTYSVSLATPDYGTKLVIAGVAKIAATPAGAVALAVGGDPLNSRGVGLYFSTVVNQLRLIIKAGAATYDTVNWTLTSTTTEFRYYVEIDTAALTATLYVNGALISSQALVNANAALPMVLWTMGANRELPTPAVMRFAAVSVAKLLVLANDAAQPDRHLPCGLRAIPMTNPTRRELLAPARGILIGLLIMIPVWLFVGWLIAA